MSKDHIIEIDGKITEVLPGGNYKVLLSQGHTVTARVSGKMRMHSIKIVVGDPVKVEVSPYELNRGRIVYRGS